MEKYFKEIGSTWVNGLGQQFEYISPNLCSEFPVPSKTQTKPLKPTPFDVVNADLAIPNL